LGAAPIRSGPAGGDGDRYRIIELIEASTCLFITAGMGGGTQGRARPWVAQVANELGILTVACGH